jgi:hypothetical protein
VVRWLDTVEGRIKRASVEPLPSVPTGLPLPRRVGVRR